MTKQLKIVLVLAAVIFLSGIIGTIFVLMPSESSMVEIVQDGKVLYSFDLTATKDQKIFITSSEGKTNTVEIKDGKIFIVHAECPDQTCVKTGVLYSESLPIVCLPNKLIIRFR